MHPSEYGRATLADAVGAEPARATDSESDREQFLYPGIH